MAFNAAEIAVIGKSTLDLDLRNKPIAQTIHDKPLLKLLNANKKPFAGAKEFIRENILTGTGSNFQNIKGAGVVTYNHRDIIDQAQYPWTGAHDGFFLSEDELTANGITVHDGKKGQGTKNELIQLVNLLEEHTEALREGFNTSLDYQLHLDGTGGVDAIAGLDHLVSLNPTVGVVGGIDRALVPFWRNQVAAALTAANILNAMEATWRQCIRNGGAPNAILAGSAFIDVYRAAASANNRVIVQNGTQSKVEGGADDITFKGIPIVWDPTFDDIDINLSPLNPWAKRCYFLNKKHICLRPIKGQDMVSRNPTRPHDQYIQHWAMTWKGGLTMNRANAHAVLSVA